MWPRLLRIEFSICLLGSMAGLAVSGYKAAVWGGGDLRLKEACPSTAAVLFDDEDDMGVLCGWWYKNRPRILDTGPVCLSVCLCVCVFLSVCLCLSVCLSVCMSANCICLSVCLSVCLFVSVLCLSVA